jgi:hypothetical protein
VKQNIPYFLLKRKFTLFSLVLITPLGFMIKMYSGPPDSWISQHLAGSFYEIFWILIIYLFLAERISIHIIPVFVFLLTSLLEFLQLWHPTFLEVVRSTFTGRVLIGSTFSWFDFPFYILGCIIGWFWIRALARWED